MKKEKLEQASSNILRGIDIESSALILEEAIFNNCIIIGGRTNILKVATRQILDFIENSKINNVGDRNILDYVKENVKIKEEIKKDKQKVVEKVKQKIDSLETTLYLCEEDGKRIAQYKIMNLKKEIEDFKEILEIIEKWGSDENGRF